MSKKKQQAQQDFTLLDNAVWDSVSVLQNLLTAPNMSYSDLVSGIRCVSAGLMFASDMATGRKNDAR